MAEEPLLTRQVLIKACRRLSTRLTAGGIRADIFVFGGGDGARI